MKFTNDGGLIIPNDQIDAFTMKALNAATKKLTVTWGSNDVILHRLYGKQLESPVSEAFAVQCTFGLIKSNLATA